VIVVVAVAIAGLVLAVGWLLLAPVFVEGTIAGSLEDGARVDLRIRFAPIAVDVHGSDVDVTIVGLRLRRRGAGARPHRDGAPRERRARFDERWRLDDVLRVVVRHRHLLVVRRLEGVVRYGCEDPALTGQAHGLLSTAQPLFAPPARVTFLADWSMHDVLDGRLDVTLRVYAGRLAVALAWAMLSRSVRRRRPPARRRPGPGRSDTSRTAPAHAA
jgi:hypothetical protein